ncbi:MAG: hypothetical protein IJ980_07025, partial [Oscillospiraceae bacterium]|nr:hypothetical protein [Oscillospiraceae bacterium]
IRVRIDSFLFISFLFKNAIIANIQQIPLREADSPACFPTGLMRFRRPLDWESLAAVIADERTCSVIFFDTHINLAFRHLLL